MKKINTAKKHIEIGEYLEAKEILLELYNDDSFDMEVLRLLLDTYYQLEQNNIEYDFEGFISIYERINKINKDDEYLDIYKDIYNNYLYIIDYESKINDLCFDISWKKIHDYNMAHCHDNMKDQEKANRELLDLIIKDLNLKVSKKEKNRGYRGILEIKSLLNGDVEITETFESSTEHYSNVSVGTTNVGVSYFTKDPTKYYDTTFENKNNNITVEEIVENLKVLNDDIEKMTIADKKNKTIKKILSIFVILIAIILNIILYKSSLLLGIITSIILLSIYFFFKENY